MEFPSSLLEKEKNILLIKANKTWRFRKLWIKNIYGYSTGAVSLVVINKQNSYKNVESPQDYSHYLFYLIFFFIFSSFLNTLPYWRTRSANQTIKAINRNFFILLLPPFLDSKDPISPPCLDRIHLPPL